MEQMRKELDGLNQQVNWVKHRQNIEIIAIGCIAVSVIIAVIFIAKAINQKGEYTLQSVKNLHEQNEQLQKNNQQLIETVESLGFTIVDRTRRDSIKWVQVEANNQLIPGINQRLKTIDQQYEKNINAIRSFNDDDVQRYITVEANRLRAVD
jgi:hypothetical protein